MASSVSTTTAPEEGKDSAVAASSKSKPAAGKTADAPASPALFDLSEYAGGPPGATPQNTDRRRAPAAADDTKLAELGLRPPSAVSAASPARQGNQRRTPGLIRLILALLAVMLACFACFTTFLYSYYQRTLVPELRSIKEALASGDAPHELDSSAALASTRTELASARNDLSKAHNQIASLQKQITALQDKQNAADERLAKFAENMQTALASTKPAEAGAGLNAAMQVASMVPVVSPTNEQLWLLKERNRLTLYADQAISQGSSEAMASLWRSLDDPELAKLREGTQAEIIRVQNFYAHLSRVPPEYRLPVRDLFQEDPTIRSEADLPPAQLIKLLLDQKQPVEVRTRSAFVLGGQRSDAVRIALLECMKHDPVLDVVKEAQRTLQTDYNMRVPPLHMQAAEEWEKLNSAAPAK